MVRASRSRRIRGCTSAKAYPFVPVAFFRRDLRFQSRIVEDLVTDKIDACDSRSRTLRDGKDQIDPVLWPLDDLGIHGSGKLSVASIQFDDPLNVSLDSGTRKYRS